MNAIRHMVSGSNQRFIENGVDLDLTYITPRIIAMGYPSTGIESSYRNPATIVSEFLDRRHAGHFKVYNLSERTYHDSLFTGPVLFFPFPDHHAPPFQLLLNVLESLHEWLSADPENVAVVHCIAGHGRTGTVICAFLMFEGIEAKSSGAFDLFARTRSTTRKGVEHPSQRRYVLYAEQHLNTCTPDKKYESFNVPMRIKSLKFENILLKRKERRLQVIVFDDKWDPVFNSSWIEQNKLTNSDLIEVALPNVVVQCDFTVKLFVIDGLVQQKPKELLRTSMNTRFITDNEIVLFQYDLDGPHKDKNNETFDPGMKLTINLEKVA